MTTTPNDLAEGQTYFTTRGIVAIQDFYMEDDLYKVRFRLHTVNREDGVTATGESLLMSTMPSLLCDWINHFPRDIEERRRSSSHEVQTRIIKAVADGPKVPYHTKGGKVYHDNPQCTEGNNIEPKNKAYGMAGLDKCSHCERNQ